jgi:hypothetical protein
MSKRTTDIIIAKLEAARTARDIDRINGYREACKDFKRITTEESEVLYRTICGIHAAVTKPL